MAKEPPPHELKLFEEIYIDETAQHERYLVLGGITIPRNLSRQFEKDIIEARNPRLALHLTKEMQPSEIGWNEVSNGDFEKYRKVVDAYFSFGKKHLKSSLTNVQFHASVVDTHVRDRHYTGQQGQLGFNKEIYFHCMTIARRHKFNLFDVYPDERTTNMTMREMQTILRAGLRKEGSENRRARAFRKVEFRHSHEVQALQISDLLIGAIQYRLNGYFDKPGGRDKKRLAEHILRAGEYWGFTSDPVPREKAFGQFQVFIREHTS